eukprot:scaffold4917_cov120-Cylindrotheca_fusiformis.AAC.7
MAVRLWPWLVYGTEELVDHPLHSCPMHLGARSIVSSTTMMMAPPIHQPVPGDVTLGNVVAR